MIRLMHCYGNKGLLACIDTEAISEITWHEECMHIYWRHKYEEYGNILTARVGSIRCNWTKVVEVESSVINYIEQTTPVILKDNTIYSTYDVMNTPDIVIK